jgi:predicted amidohydrolase YtcJ
VSLAVCQGAQAQSHLDLNVPSLVLANSKILTLDSRCTVAEALAIRDGKILPVGDNSATIWSMASGQIRTIDRGGKTVVPELTDTHAHFKAAKPT